MFISHPFRFFVALPLMMLGLLVSLSANDAQAETLVLTDAAIAPAPIVTLRNDRHAARNLADYLGQISGQTFEVVTRGEHLPTRAIVVGTRLAEVPEVDDLPLNGFVIRRVGERLFISGRTDLATRFAVFSFLEDDLGCRWWTHNEEFVPQRETLQIGVLDRVVNPPFLMHELMNSEAKQDDFRFKARSISPVSFTGGHNLCGMLRPYAQEHPEFLPTDNKGNRKFNNLHMNYTAPGMPEALATELAKEVQRRKGDLESNIYFAGMGDWYGGMDLTEASQKIYADETWTDPDGREKPGYTATLLQMINATAEIMDENHPGIMLGTFAYMSLEAPPAHTRPATNVAIWLPRLRHDTVRSIRESRHNRSFQRNMERWAELAPDRLYIWEYGANYHNFLMPFPCLYSIAENIRIYHEHGIRGIRIQGNYVSTGGDLAALKNYVWRKLMWEPHLETDDLIAEFCHGYYGPAADAVIKYVETLESFVREPEPVRAHEFRPIPQYITQPMRDELRAILTEGLATLDGQQPFDRRVREVLVSVEAADLWLGGELEESNGKLVRKDLDGAYTWERGLQVIEHLRGASPREWGNGPAYQMDFLRRQGGPVATLETGALSVKVAPVQNGRTQVFHNDRPIVLSTTDRPAHGMRVGMPADDFGPDNITFSLDLGVANWSRNVKQRLERTVALDDDTIVFSGTLQQVAAGANYANGIVRPTTYYRAPTPDAIGIEYLDADGQWQRVTLTAEEPEVAIAAVRGWRIRPAVADDVVVLDHYALETPGTGKVTFQEDQKRVEVVINLPEFAIVRDTATPYAERRLQIQPAN